MILKEALEHIGTCLVDCTGKRFTGQIVFTLHLRQGGIAKASLRQERELATADGDVREQAPGFSYEV